ncbi:hypothetical protein [Tellurirhabdus rosea]|uniref:hypothetical protein n=1 Tax=Tellurirhabdus rosea TaxID=2674997 RepID=UPI002256DFFA|nr:hypothetical protein [Tellurirhabdus rosea]
MKNLSPILRLAAFCLGLLLPVAAAFGQAVYSGTEKIDQQDVKGLTIQIPIEGKFVEKEWETLVKTFGRVVTGRGGIAKVPSADIKSLSPNPVNFLSKLSSARDKATLFVAADLGSGNFVTVGSPEYNELEKLLKDFAARTQYNNELRLAELAFTETQKRHEKSVKTGEKLVRDIERNKREAENLKKRLEENAAELKRLEKETETNKTEQTSVLAELETKKKAVEDVKGRGPK